MNDKGMILKATTMTLSTLNDEYDDDVINKDLKQGRRRRQWKRRQKKWIFVLSNLIASIMTRSIYQKQATFPGFEFLRIYSGSKRGRKIRRRMFTPTVKRHIGRFHVVVVQWTSKKCTNKRDARAELLFWSLKLLFVCFFWSRRCGRRRSCLSSLMTTIMVMVNDDDDNGDGDKTMLKQDDWISTKYFQ